MLNVRRFPPPSSRTYQLRYTALDILLHGIKITKPIMYARKESMRGGAPPHKNNLIGTVARGWTQIGPFKVDNNALFIARLL